jgi:hypothetical protein
MVRLALFVAAALTLLAADDPWLKVKHLHSRQELKIYKMGIAEPLNATFADANDDRVIVVVKNKEMAISRDDVDRIDARPVAKGPATREATVKTVDPDYRPRPPHGDDVPGTSASSNVSFGKPAFETVYRRSGAPAK